MNNLETPSAEHEAMEKLDFEDSCVKMTERQKTAVLLHRDGYTLREIGAMLDISHQSVLRLLRRGGAKMVVSCLCD